MLPIRAFFHFFVPHNRRLSPVKWLYPFGSIYGWGLHLRNHLYNKGIFKSEKAPVFSICIGNLALGGTGKTPMTEYMIHLFQENNVRIAVLSRGYKRKTRGFLKANELSTSEDLGDEAFQIHQKFPGIKVFVNENRVEGVKRIYGENPEIELILLDDAFQHRAISANKNILITRYDRLYTSDLYIPAGSLRDHVIRANDADVVVVSNCPDILNVSIKNEITGKLKLKNNQKLFFSGLEYQLPFSLFSDEDELSDGPCIAVSGIANPGYFLDHVESNFELIKHFSYPDHYDFSAKDVADWIKKISGLENAFIITTEKDASRLLKYRDLLIGIRVMVLPIKVHFYGDEKRFNEMALSWIKKRSE
jgi:tetraacyldisaccharide 4'-kinase